MCMKRKISRRQFMKEAASLGALSACSLGAWGRLGNRIAHAQSMNGNGNTLIILNLFGGIDGLNWIIPYSNGVYYDRRPTIAIPEAQVLDLNGSLGFHPSWALMHDIWSDNDIAVIQQVGYPDANFSHFESQDIWSAGKRSIKGAADQRGWLGRLVDTYFPQDSYKMFGVGVSYQSDFQTNVAPKPIILESLGEYSYQDDYSAGPDNQYRQQLAQNHFNSISSGQSNRAQLQSAMQAMHPSVNVMEGLESGYSSSVVYPEDNYLARKLNDVAKIVTGSIGSQVIYTGLAGWDTHDEQSSFFGQQLLNVSTALNAFITDLKLSGQWNKTTIVLSSEFGRNTFENGGRGTDHGHGNSMVVMGGNVNGGIYGPTPTTADLNMDYLDYAIDFRSVYKAVVRDHLGLNPDPVFSETIVTKDVSLDLFT